MEDDMEVGLVQQFSCLGTTDKEVLVAQLQKVVGPQLNASAAHFFLDMNNWNLQLAVGAYFDLTDDSPPSTQQNFTPHTNAAASQHNWNEDECWEPDAQPQPQPATELGVNFRKEKFDMSVLQDMSVTEDTIIPPRTKFVKQWKIQNTGISPWPPGSHLRHISGNRSMVAQQKTFINPQVQPGESREVYVECLSPEFPGNYQLCFQMSTPEGFYFGDEIWVICNVAPDLTVGLTQQLQSLTCDNSRVNYPVVQHMNPLNHSSPSMTNAQVPTAAAVGGEASFVISSQDQSTDMS